jgi:hypothetical protein
MQHSLKMLNILHQIAFYKSYQLRSSKIIGPVTSVRTHNGVELAGKEALNLESKYNHGILETTKIEISQAKIIHPGGIMLILYLTMMWLVYIRHDYEGGK